MHARVHSVAFGLLASHRDVMDAHYRFLCSALAVCVGGVGGHVCALGRGACT